MNYENFSAYAPLPPIAAVVPSATAEFIFLWVAVAGAVGGIIYAWIYGRKTKSLVPMMLMIGGGLTTFLEPLADSHLQVWWPVHNQMTIFTVWGRSLPVMIVPILIWYFGIGILIRVHLLQKYGAASPLWLAFAIEVGMAYLLEPPAIALGLWHWYGEQGPRFFGYPIWWPFVAGACGCFAGTLVYKMLPYLTGWKQIFVAPLVPMAVAAVYWGGSWPMMFALNLNAPIWAIYVAATACAAMSFGIVWMCTIATGGYALKQQKKAGSAADGRSSNSLGDQLVQDNRP